MTDHMDHLDQQAAPAFLVYPALQVQYTVMLQFLLHLLLADLFVVGRDGLEGPSGPRGPKGAPGMQGNDGIKGDLQRLFRQFHGLQFSLVE